ncbi:MAG: hemerythrin domain-containing protein [Acidobacteria bacterium]|nr:hemerythrin domain-containing protein [Acidobacteriota bacterium]
MDTQRYREHHQEVRVLAGELDRLLDPMELAKDGIPAWRILGELADKLTVHLAMEDRLLYPTLLNSGREEASALAHRYSEDMGGVREAFGAYLATWRSGSAIQKDPNGFIAQSRVMIAAVGMRIEAEEAHLYPAAERPGK